MHILFLNDDLPPETLGGSGRVIMETSTELRARGHEVTILTAGALSGKRIVAEGITVYTIPKRGTRWAHYRGVFGVKRAREVLAVIEELQPDIIHAHLLAWQLGYRWIHHAVRRGFPVFFTFHSVIPVAYWKVTTQEKALWLRDLLQARWTWNPFRNVLIRGALQKTHLLSVSDALKEYVGRFHYRNVMTLRNGVDSTFWRDAMPQKAAREKHGLPADAPLFLLAGRLGHDKGLVFLWDLWTSLTGNPHLILAGQLPLPIPDHLKARMHVFPSQSREQMRELYLAADVVLVPSICFDSLPTVALEAMACARPVIAADRGGAKEAVADGVTGWILPAAAVDPWRERLQHAINNCGALLSMGKQGERRAQEKFSLKKHVDVLLGLYEGARKVVA